MSAASGRVCVVGSFNEDTTLGVAALPGPGETTLTRGTRLVSPGGKGANQAAAAAVLGARVTICLLYTSPSPRDATLSRMPSSA